MKKVFNLMVLFFDMLSEDEAYSLGFGHPSFSLINLVRLISQQLLTEF